MEKTIIEGNKLIAEFMDFDLQESEKYKGGQALYHISWDWIMPVVAKIKDYVLIDKPYEGLLDKIDVLNLYITAPINTVWEQCVYAIKFINSQSK